VKNALETGVYPVAADFFSCGRGTTIFDQKNEPDFGKNPPVSPKILSAMKYPG
jgi:hypothetical protein